MKPQGNKHLLRDPGRRRRTKHPDPVGVLGQLLDRLTPAAEHERDAHRCSVDVKNAEVDNPGVTVHEDRVDRARIETRQGVRLEPGEGGGTRAFRRVAVGDAEDLTLPVEWGKA